MRSPLLPLVWTCLILAAPAQIVINEVYTGTPDFIEIRNFGPNPVDVSNWSLETFQSSGSGTPASEGSFTLPAGTIIASLEQVLLEENGTAGAAGTLGPCAIRTGFNYNWTSTRNVVVILRDAGGVAQDYMYRNVSGPSGTPHLPGNQAWTGTLSTTGNVIFRNSDSDTDDAGDWSLSSSTTPCTINPGQSTAPPPPPPLDLNITTTGVGDATITIDSDPQLPGAEFYTIFSLIIYNPVGSGPVFGVGLDSISYFTVPAAPGSPFHSNLDGSGSFSFIAFAGTAPPGFHVQAASVAIRPDLTIIASPVVDITF